MYCEYLYKFNVYTGVCKSMVLTRELFGGNFEVRNAKWKSEEMSSTTDNRHE